MSDHGHLFSLKEAARACEVSPVTIRRRLRDETFPNAFKESIDGSETWQIPLGDLLGAGFTPTSSGQATTEPAEVTVPVVEVIEAVAAATPTAEPIDVAEVSELRSELVAAEHRAELAEARAEERQRLIDILERQVRVLMPGPPVAGTASDGPSVLTEPVRTEPLRRKRWWQR